MYIFKLVDLIQDASSVIVPHNIFTYVSSAIWPLY